MSAECSKICGTCRHYIREGEDYISGEMYGKCKLPSLINPDGISTDEGGGCEDWEPRTVEKEAT